MKISRENVIKFRRKEKIISLIGIGLIILICLLPVFKDDIYTPWVLSKKRAYTCARIYKTEMGLNGPDIYFEYIVNDVTYTGVMSSKYRHDFSVDELYLLVYSPDRPDLSTIETEYRLASHLPANK